MEQGWKARAAAAQKRNHHTSDVNEVRRRFYDLKKKGLKSEDAAAIAQGKLDAPDGLGLPAPAPLPEGTVIADGPTTGGTADDTPPPAPTTDEVEAATDPAEESTADPAEKSEPEVEELAPVAAPEDDEADDELAEDLKPIK